jgi:hypothetical protein
MKAIIELASVYETSPDWLRYLERRGLVVGKFGCFVVQTVSLEKRLIVFVGAKTAGVVETVQLVQIGWQMDLLR